jgi:hypothetical protein
MSFPNFDQKIEFSTDFDAENYPDLANFLIVTVHAYAGVSSGVCETTKFYC